MMSLVESPLRETFLGDFPGRSLGGPPGIPLWLMGDAPKHFSMLHKCFFSVGGVTENLKIMFLFQSESTFKAKKRHNLDGNRVVLILRSNG